MGINYLSLSNVNTVFILFPFNLIRRGGMAHDFGEGG